MAARKARSPSPASGTRAVSIGARQAGRAVAHHLLTNQTLFMFVVLLVMMLGFAPAVPVLPWTKDNLLQVTVQAAVICMLGAGQTFVILTAGIDLGVGSVLALVTVVSAIVMESWAGLARSNVLIAGQQGGGLIPGLVAGLLVGAACGLANGVVIGKLRVPPFVATLGMMGIARGLALNRDRRDSPLPAGAGGGLRGTGPRARHPCADHLGPATLRSVLRGPHTGLGWAATPTRSAATRRPPTCRASTFPAIWWSST